MKKSTKVFAAVAGAMLVVAGGSAYTAANTVPASIAGYGSASVTGAVATNIQHELADDGVTIESTVITFDASQADNKVVAGFGAAGALLECDVVTTVATCDWTDPGPAPTTASAANFRVAVSSN